MPEALQKVNIGLQHEMQHKKVLENQGLFNESEWRDSNP
jgi:hypothetical protein